jgi:N-acetylmuramoyl-L-alanine amidase
VWEGARSQASAAPISSADLLRELHVTQRYIPEGCYGRRYDRPMTPRYITIHSTQNYSGDAWDHALALQRGKLRGGTCGYLCWHYTVQDDAVVQHLPTNERGEHADFDGPGNRYSIGIEMCEHRGNNRAQTIEQTAWCRTITGRATSTTPRTRTARISSSTTAARVRPGSGS